MKEIMMDKIYVIYDTNEEKFLKGPAGRIAWTKHLSYSRRFRFESHVKLFLEYVRDVPDSWIVVAYELHYKEAYHIQNYIKKEV